MVRYLAPLKKFWKKIKVVLGVHSANGAIRVQKANLKPLYEEFEKAVVLVFIGDPDRNRIMLKTHNDGGN